MTEPTAYIKNKDAAGKEFLLEFIVKVIISWFALNYNFQIYFEWKVIDSHINVINK